MVPDNIPNIDPVGSGQPVDSAGQAPKAADAEFRRMLERLEAIAKQADSDKRGGQVEGADDLAKALKQADQDFVTAMDLRRKLEDAYRRNQP